MGIRVPIFSAELSSEAYVREDVESALLSIWRHTLGIDTVSLTDDFFRLGGSSLSATQVISRIRDVFGVELSFRQLFDHPTVLDTADWLRLNGPARSVRPVPSLGAAGRSSPLSPSQQSIWFQQQLDERAVQYNLAEAGVLTGKVDLDRLERALHTAAREHTSLRTRIIASGGTPVAIVDPEPTHQLVIHDVRSLPGPARLDAARELVGDLLNAPYDLENGPLFRAAAVRLGNERALLGIGMHHVVGDVWSFGVLDRAVRDAYERDDGNVTIHVDTGYHDYVAWQREFDGNVLENQLRFWKDTLDGVQPLMLPTDLARPPFQTFEGNYLWVDLTPSVRKRLEEYAAEHKATPFMVGLAVFNIVLSNYSGQNDIVVGSPIAGRSAIETEGIIGTFVNTLAYRNSLDGVETFSGLLHRVRHNALAAYMHQDLPFQRLVESLELDRDPSRSPVFQVMFNVINERMQETGPSGGGLTYVPLPIPAVQADIEVNIGLNETRSDIRLMYNTRLFEKQTAQRMLDMYVETLTRVIERPEARLVDLLAQPGSERAVLDSWNETSVPVGADDDVLVLLMDAARKDPDKVALHAADGTYSYAELVIRARQVTAALMDKGVRPGDRVAVLMERGRDLVPVLLGIMGTGSAYIPLDPKYPEARLRFILEDAGVSVMVSKRGLPDRFRMPGVVLLIEDIDAEDTADFVSFASELPAYVIYTSGSTGTPKGVELTRGNVANFLLGMRQRPGISAHDVLLAVTTISFDIAVLELYLPLTVGARIMLVDEEDATDGRRLMRLMEDHGVTVMQATPATWKLLISAGWSGHQRLRILCGGEALPRDLADQLLARAAEVWNMYGPTETTVWSTLDRVGDGPITVGTPIANTTLHVLDRDRRPVVIGRPGELYIGGLGVANGYVNRSELTSDRFINHPVADGGRIYGTGDLVRLRNDGRVEHLGRLDNQVKVRGFRVELGEVEEALRSHEAIADAVAGVDRDRLVGYVVFKPRETATTSDIRRWVGDSLPPHMVPNQLIVLDALPLTPNGKVDRRALPLVGASTQEPSFLDSGWAHSDPNLLVLYEVWAGLLGHTEVHPDDNFFEIGGHSLLAMDMIGQVEQRTGHRLKLRSIFFRSLQELAAELPAISTKDL